jgi:hypothetical protein
MQKITGTVGDKGTNNVSDVALVQAILLKTTRAATRTTPAAPYLTSYDGDCGKFTKAAIRAFQDDHVFVSKDGLQCAPNPRATPGIVGPDDATWEKLIEKVDPAFSDMRVMQGGKTVYVAATAEQLAARIEAVGRLTFTAVFRAKVIACINRMHELYGIAVGVCREGDRRTFEAQYLLLTSGRNVTSAGPGESNHNFGMAVDLGFERLRWLKKRGEVTENETSWFHILNPDQNVIGPEAMKFWEALRSVGTSDAVGAFRGPVGDRPHLQNWNDAGVDMATRLADLVTRSGTMRWRGANQAYSCDLGFGGDFYRVGSARQIWNRQATVTIDMLTRARAAQAVRAGAGRPMAQAAAVPGRAPQPGNAARGAPRVQPVTQADVAAMQQALRREFETADANWQNWTPA